MYCVYRVAHKKRPKLWRWTGVKLRGSRRISAPPPQLLDPPPVIWDPPPWNTDPAPFCWDPPMSSTGFWPSGGFMSVLNGWRVYYMNSRQLAVACAPGHLVILFCLTLLWYGTLKNAVLCICTRKVSSNWLHTYTYLQPFSRFSGKQGSTTFGWVI